MLKVESPSPRGTRRRRGQKLEPIDVVVGGNGSHDFPEASTTEDPDILQVKRVMLAISSDFDFNCFVGYFVAVSALIITFLVCSQLVWRLPTPLPNDYAADKFAEGRAWAYLERLQAHGPSLVGTKSNVAIANLIRDTIASIQAEVEALAAKGVLKAIPSFEIEVQRPSGALNFDLLGYTLTNHYTRLHNVIVRLSWEHHFKDDPSYIPGQYKALLVNSHFDSGVGSPGAMDARACNALMLELIRSLSHAENALHHPLIFLFNGAEESLQEGSHGFISQHPWRSTIGSILNFDAGGIGGPQILFQVGSGEYAELFASTAPRLHGSILAQELFDTGLLQGDTDYRIFRDFGDIHGLDLAWYKDGYKYHTPRDDLGFIDEGSLQHAGDNAFAYISAICSNRTRGTIWRDDELAHRQSPEYKADASKPLPDLLNAYPSRSQIIFYDFLSLWTFYYTQSLARVLHFFMVAAVAGLVFSNISFRTVISSTASIFLSNVLGIFFALIVAIWMTVSGKALSWFSNQYVIAVLYIPPFIFGWLIVHYLRTGKSLKTLFALTKPVEASNGRKRHQNESARTGSPHVVSSIKSWQQLEFESLNGVSILAASSLGLGTLLGIGSVYFWFWISGGALMALLATKLRKNAKPSKKNDNSLVPVWAYLFFLPGASLGFQVLIQSMAMAFPLSGRLPPDVPAELAIGVIFVLLASTPLVCVQPLIHRFHRYRGAARILLLAIFIGIIVGSLSFPYSPYRPKRVTIQHSMRESPAPGHPGLDSPAVLFALCDAGPTGNLVDRLTELDSRGVTPHRDVHDWDAVFPLSTFLVGYSLPAPAPAVRPPFLAVLNDTWDEASQERHLVVQFDYTGSEWSTLRFLGPLKRWNLTDSIPPYSMPTGYHIIRHIGEHNLSKWAVELTFGDKKGRRFDLTATHFISTPTVQAIVQVLPDWTAPTIMATAMSHIDVQPVN